MSDTDTLDAVRKFIATIAYGTDEQLDAMTCLLAVTHSVDSFTTVPRGLCVSDEWASGKTTFGIDVPQMLAYNGWAADPTEHALRSKFSEPHRVTLLMDEISKIFGESGLNGRNNKLYKILVEGYRCTAIVSMSVNRVATDVSTFGVAFMTGLRTACPADLRSRSIIFNMRRKPRGLDLADALDPSVQAEGEALQKTLHAWSMLRKDALEDFARNRLKRIHPKLDGRLKQIWGPLFAVAGLAGGTWPARILAAFQSMGLDASEKPVLTVQQQILLDTADICVRKGLDVIFTADLVPALRAIPDRPAYTRMSDDYLVIKLSEALGRSETLRGTTLAGRVVKGKGRRVAAILVASGALQRALCPPVEDTGPDETELELTLTEA
jgi:Protein of unknown function (DUF3631)